MNFIPDQTTIENLVRLAQQEAAKAFAKGNAPFGAVLTDAQGNIIVTAHNTQNSDNDPTAHAEINLLRVAAKKLNTLVFSDYCLFSNAEPCSMCMSACIKVKIRSIYFGAPHEPHLDPYLPAVEVASRAKDAITLHPGILKESCIQQIAEARKQTPPTD